MSSSEDGCKFVKMNKNVEFTDVEMGVVTRAKMNLSLEHSFILFKNIIKTNFIYFVSSPAEPNGKT